MRLQICFVFKNLPLDFCVDAPLMWQHARKCAQQRLRARSPTWRSSGPTCRWRGNAQLSATATPHPPPQLQATTCPHHLIGSPSNLARILSMCHMTDPQRIRAQWCPDPPQSHQNYPRSCQASQDTCRHSRLAQMLPPIRLSISRSPLPRRTTPNVTHQVARPRSGYLQIWR